MHTHYCPRCKSTPECENSSCEIRVDAIEDKEVKPQGLIFPQGAEQLCPNCVKERQQLVDQAGQVQIQPSQRQVDKLGLIQNINAVLLRMSLTIQKLLPGKSRSTLTIAINEIAPLFEELIKTIKQEETERSIGAYRLVAKRLVGQGIYERLPTLEELLTALEIKADTLQAALLVEHDENKKQA